MARRVLKQDANQNCYEFTIMLYFFLFDKVIRLLMFIWEEKMAFGQCPKGY